MNMYEDAVDDMYLGCTAKMKQMVTKKSKEEIKQYQDVWNRAGQCADRNVKRRLPVDQALTKDHMQAICVYTSGYGRFYKTLNKEVRVGRKQYGTSFPYHSLHFLLTSAIKLLKENQGCHTSYRRSFRTFTGNVNQIMRFGSFASSSFSPQMTRFGKQTCFKIKTCSGAFLKRYSHNDQEQEVLIPPHEMFKITEILKESESGVHHCKVVYFMESAGLHSNLNCKAAGI
ncbi:hypothetical protein LDENG_00265730 [Lucifuga dentata]|nr:hypothetical protein LDENG_00265730 [Lucifuga dentata]